MQNNTSLKIPKKYQARIDSVHRENCDDSMPNEAYVIYLSDGWCLARDYGVHTIIEYSQKAALEQLRDTVKCECCNDCKAAHI